MNHDTAMALDTGWPAIPLVEYPAGVERSVIVRTMIALFFTYRPLLWALVALGKAAVAATSRGSDGGRRITVEERHDLNRVFWIAYDAWTASERRN